MNLLKILVLTIFDRVKLHFLLSLNVNFSKHQSVDGLNKDIALGQR